jgi:DNA-binding NarL/FixJ family response regulator
LQKSELEKLNRELVEANAAQSIPAHIPGKKRADEQRRINNLVANKIMPLLGKLHKDKSFKRGRSDLELLMAYANGLSADSSREDSIVFALSEAELQMAVLVKNGLTIKEIARQLTISLDTVKTHRKNIKTSAKSSISKTPGST